MLRRVILMIFVFVYTVVFNSSTHMAYSMNLNEAGESHTEKSHSEQKRSINLVRTVKEKLELLYQKAIEDSEKTVLISFAGDCTLGTDASFPYINSFPYILEKQNNDYSYFFGGVRDIFKKDDLTLVNLETTLTKAEKMAGKTFRFKGDPSYVNILKTGFIEMVNISNNHIYDYLETGFNDTLNSLSGAGILYSGEGHAAFCTVKGLRIASLGYTGWDLSVKKKLKEDLEKVRMLADVLIVSFHWGDERSYYPNSVQNVLGRYSIDLGADIVVGHHPHVIQGIENYKGKYIVYSLGNFCFGGNHNPQDRDSFIFQSRFVFVGKSIARIDGVIIPCSISNTKGCNDYQPVVLEQEEKQRVLERLEVYSRNLKYGISNINTH